MSLVGSLRDVQAKPEPCNSNSNSNSNACSWPPADSSVMIIQLGGHVQLFLA